MTATVEERALPDRSRRTGGWWLRRLVVVAVVVLQLILIGRGYRSPHPTFAFQMFSEASSWQADIFRVTGDGERLDVREDWPQYQWSDLVRSRGLGSPFTRQHAASGLDSTLDFFQEALDWVALNTPADTRTQRFEADVTYWDNGRGPFRLTLRSAERLAGGVP